MTTEGTVLLVDSLSGGDRCMLFAAPREIVRAHTPDDARRALARLDEAAGEGLWAAGYLAYELGLLFEERLAPLCPQRTALPLLWFGLYDAPERMGIGDARALVAEWAGGRPGRAVGLSDTMDRAAYAKAFSTVKDYIAAGDCYQVNLTFKARFSLQGDPAGLYRDLLLKQPVAYGAFVDAGDHHVLSCSPELFVRRRGGELETRPMKGTLGRGRTVAEDEAGRAALARDEKTLAENLMIVDLLRNDMGRIAEIGSVEVTDLFSIETYRSLHQMTSGIRARLKPGLSAVGALAHLFPCGSITGAPKIRAMEIVHEVEAEPRGLYTGAMGYIAPDGDLCFNVAIRTAVIDGTGCGEIGIGGGIVADSELEAEYDEARLKMRFFTDPPQPVCLIETLLWERGRGFALLDRHMARLGESAAYFQIALAPGAAETALEAAAGAFDAERMRVRLLLHEADGLSVTATPLPDAGGAAPMRFLIAAEHTRSGDVFLYHKTTRRELYDTARMDAARRHGVDEVVFVNERGELTEGSFTTLFLERDGLLVTPPVGAGLLPGTLRAELLASGRAREEALRPGDLATADAVYLGNSVRGLLPAVRVMPDGQ